MVFRCALVGSSHLLFDEEPSLHSKKLDDRHVVENLELLRYGELPTFQLTHEARDIFWTCTSFQVEWYKSGNFSLGFRMCSRCPSLYFIPRDCIRNIRINIYTEETYNHRSEHWFGDPSPTLRQLLDFPTLQTLEIVIRMPMEPYNDSHAIHRVSQIKQVCLKLIKKYGKGFTVFTERSAYERYEKEPYDWDLLTEVDGDDEEVAGLVDKADKDRAIRLL